MSGRIVRTGLVAAVLGAVLAGAMLIGGPLASAQEPSPTQVEEQEATQTPEEEVAPTQEATPSDSEDTDEAPAENGTEESRDKANCDREREDGASSTGFGFRGGGGPRA